MFAIAFDMKIAEVEAIHPKGFQSAYGEIAATLRRFGFRRIQGSVYIVEGENLLVVTQAMEALRDLDWFAPCVRDIRAFRVEMWSDFTAFFKDSPS